MGARSLALGFDSRRAVSHNNYAFVDSQNVVATLRHCGWKLDWRRFQRYLVEHHGVSRTYLFLPLPPPAPHAYATWWRWGFTPVLRPATAVRRGRPKANVDVDLVFRAMLAFPEYHQAVIVSGDGDFYTLVKYLLDAGKLRAVISPHRTHCSALLRHVARERILCLQRLRRSMEERPTQRAEP
ncbi:MAG TPA: NYN domain-containing protein [Gemmatimonadales bacterium]|nr:NYN domain-containing protein [Gemmatimonadales bacterium]